jgi:glc operon protein GlcG
MVRVSAMAGGLCVALLVSSGAFAQVPPDPNNPNEAVPEKYSYTPYGEPIKLEQARKVAAAALAEATKRSWPMCISIVGPTGDLVYFEKMDDCQYASSVRRWSSSDCSARARISATWRRSMT